MVHKNTSLKQNPEIINMFNCNQDLLNNYLIGYYQNVFIFVTYIFEVNC
jgi:hypothetical protein